MIILDDRNHIEKNLLLTKREQIQGSQTWITEYPAEIHTRCHFWDGIFSIEQVEILDLGVVELLGMYLCDESEFMHLNDTIQEKLSNTTLSEEEFECLTHKVFLQLLALRYPEITQNETYNIIVSGLEDIQQLERQFIGRPIEDIIQYLDEQTKTSNQDKKKTFEAIKNIYQNNGIDWPCTARQKFLEYQQDFFRYNENAEEQVAPQRVQTTDDRTGAEKIIEFMKQNGLGPHDLTLALTMTLAKTSDRTNAEQHIVSRTNSDRENSDSEAHEL